MGTFTTYYSNALNALCGVGTNTYTITDSTRLIYAGTQPLYGYMYGCRDFEPIQTFMGKKIIREDSEDKIAASEEMKRYIKSLEREAETKK